MTEAGWPAGKDVKEIGWYWWRLHPHRMKVVEVVQDYEGGPLRSYVNGMWIYLEQSGAEWLGPLSPDDKAQGRVEGLREAAGMVDDDCYIDGGELLPDFEHRCKHNVNQKELAGKIRFRANALAQAAQDEKGVGDAGR